MINSKDYDGEWFRRFRPLQPQTNFALQYPDISIMVRTFSEDMTSLYEFLIDKELEILKLDGHNDSAGLDDSHISTRWDKYNIFKFTHPTLDKLKQHVISLHKDYCFKCGVQPTPIMLHAWYNVVRHGDSITEHSHEQGNYAYLSANIFVGGDWDDSHTRYVMINRDENVDIVNNAGDATIFPAYLPHYTNVYKGAYPRISIGINLFPQYLYDEFEKNKDMHNWLQYLEYE